jgi:GntR family transcriptional repressor for pyruvate dehydrogenase complex
MKSTPSTTTSFPKLSAAPNLVDQVVEQIRAEVLAGRLQSGDTLPAEGKLAEQFGVSRTVIREAMHQLRFAGLIEISHGKRPRVKAPNAEASLVSLVTWMQRSDLAAHQLLEVRRPIECEIVRLAMPNIGPAQVDSLQQTIDALGSATRMQVRIDADASFHQQLAEATGNPIFTLLLDALAELLNEQRRQTLRGPGGVRAARDHQVILDAIASGDVPAAQQAVSDHLVWPRD